MGNVINISPRAEAGGSNGISPHIGENGNWFIGEVDTGVKAQGQDGTSGVSPHIDETTGRWFIGTEDTGVLANGQTNVEITQVTVSAADWDTETLTQDITVAGISANEGEQIVTLNPALGSQDICTDCEIKCVAFNTNSITLQAGTLPTEDVIIYVAITKTGNALHIDETTGHWFVGNTDTGVKATGDDGVTPHIDEATGNWFIGETDTGVKAKGKDGTTPQKGIDYFTESDKSELVTAVLAAMPTAEGGSF